MQKPKLSVCVQPPLALTCDQFIFNDIGKFFFYHYSVLNTFIKLWDCWSLILKELLKFLYSQRSSNFTFYMAIIDSRLKQETTVTFGEK